MAKTFLLCLLLGIAAAGGFAPLELWPLAVAALAAWIAIVRQAPTLRAALWRGWAFGVGHFTINDNWFQHAFDFQDKMPPVLGYAAPLALALYLAVYPAMAAGIAWRFRGPRPDIAYALAFAAAWIATEWLRATMFTGYAWDPVAVIWVPVQPVASLAAYIGTYALSGVTVLLAGALLLVPRRALPLGLATLGFAALLVAQAFSYKDFATRAPIAANEPRLVVVQPNVGLERDGQIDTAKLYPALAAQSGLPGLAPRLLLWPEGAIRDPVEDGYPGWVYAVPAATMRAQLATLLGPRDTLVSGGEALNFDRLEKLASATNSVFAIDGKGRLAGRYDKAHLVPYGEYLPMRGIMEPLGLARLVPGDVDFIPGPGPAAIEVPAFGSIGVQICYEIVFSGQVIDRAHRPRLLFNPSTDAWFGRWGPPQHLAQARMRAIEEGMPIARATPTGISAVIAADGRLIGTVSAGRAGRIEVRLPPAAPPTLFARVGNAMAGIVAAMLLLAAIVIRWRQRYG